MIESLLVYLGCMLVMMYFASLAGASEKHSLYWAGLSSLVFGVVMGIRWNVGVDFPMYYQIYEQIKAGTFAFGYNRMEPGFKLFYYFFATQYVHYSIPFGILSFFQMFLVFLGTKTQKQCWVYLPLTLMLTSTIFPFNNIIRHMLAFGFVVCSITPLAERKYWNFLLWILAAACFHKSAMIFLIFPAIYMFLSKIFQRLWIQFVLVGISLVIMNIDYVQEIFEMLSFGMQVMGYDFYAESNFAEFNNRLALGIAMVLTVGVNVILILQSNRIKEFYNTRIVNIIYDMYFLGLIIRFAFLRMFLIQRLNWYFHGFEFIFAALALYYFFKRGDWLWFAAWTSVSLVLFVYKFISNAEGLIFYQTFFD